MSRLLIPLSGQASKSLSKGTGLVIAPDSHLHVMRYDFTHGLIANGLTSANGQGGTEVSVLNFPGSRNVLFQTSIGTQSAALTAKAKGTNTAGLAIAASGEDYEFAPYYQHTADGAGKIASTEYLNQNVFKVGTSPAFYMKTTFQVSDVSAVTEHFFGFLRKGIHAADVENYTDAYGVMIANTAVNEFIILNDATTDVNDTDINQVNNTNITVEVLVSDTGVCTAKVDGVDITALATSAGMTFDDGDIVYPALHITQGASVLSVSAFECGSQAADQ